MGRSLRIVEQPTTAVSILNPMRPGYRVLFSPKWADLVGAQCVSTGGRGQTLLWNREHPLVDACTDESWAWIVSKRFDRDERDPLVHRDLLLRSEAHAAALILNMLLNGEKLVWEGLVDRDRQL